MSRLGSIVPDAEAEAEPVSAVNVMLDFRFLARDSGPV